MSKYVLDGQVYVQKKTGIYRYCNEILKELDKIIAPDEIELVVPKEAVIDHEFTNIKVIRYGSGKGVFWAQTYLVIYCLKNKTIPISFYNTTPIFRPGIVVIHDVAYKAFHRGYNSLYGRLSSLWHRFNYWYISNQKYEIISVSQFSKDEICRYYNVNPKRITVIGNGWQHYQSIELDDSVFDKFRQIIPGEYFFSFGSLEERKNFKWIVEVAKRNTDQFFVIAGGEVKNTSSKLFNEDIKNVIFVGYLEDEKIKALLSHAKAFIFPSIYEGFGIPPLEALSVGTSVICAKSSSLPEILENSAIYIDPYNYDVNMTELMDKKIECDATKILEKYSWKQSAYYFLKLLERK